MKKFDGRANSKILDKKIEDYLAKNSIEGNLAIIQIGDDSASSKYVTIKEKFAKRFEIPVQVVRLDHEKMKSLEVVVKGSDVIYSPSNTSVIIQLPLPKPRFYSLLTKIPYKKDVDLLSEGAKRKFYSGDFSRLPPVVRGIEYFLESNDIDVEGKTVLVVGFSELVGKPAAFFLQSNGAKVEVTEDYKPALAKDKDLVVLSAGKPNLVKGEDLPKGCHVIDFGSSVVKGKTIGDLDLDSKLDHLGVVSPSPGGMGPLVVRFLLMNHLGV